MNSGCCQIDCPAATRNSNTCPVFTAIQTVLKSVCRNSIIIGNSTTNYSFLNCSSSSRKTRNLNNRPVRVLVNLQFNWLRIASISRSIFYLEGKVISSIFKFCCVKMARPVCCTVECNIGVFFFQIIPNTNWFYIRSNT